MLSVFKRTPSAAIRFVHPANHMLVMMALVLFTATASVFVTWTVFAPLQLRPLTEKIGELQAINTMRTQEIRSMMALSVSFLAPQDPPANDAASQVVEKPIKAPETGRAVRSEPTIQKPTPARSVTSTEVPPPVVQSAPASPVVASQPTPVEASPVASATVAAAVKPKFSVTFKEASIKGLDASSVYFSSGREVKVGGRLGSGETLLNVNPATGTIVTDQRIIQLRAE